jgi:hypothetical protein
MSSRRALVLVAVEALLVLLAHALLLGWFADGQVAQVLFTGGHDASAGTILGALAFFGVRLFLHLALPGLVLAQLVWLLWPRPRPAVEAADAA